ncbi:MAG: ribonuclease P protein component [Actinomycetota bacterium]|nr:ribonuclease P protein component [Actinomycetota bacterium]
METLKNSSDFRKVIDRGSREILGTITVFRLLNEKGITRIGISVSKKTGNSVTRNKIKRRIREAIRKSASFLPAGEDIVIIARRKAANKGYKEVEKDVLEILKVRKVEGEIE